MVIENTKRSLLSTFWVFLLIAFAALIPITSWSDGIAFLLLICWLVGLIKKEIQINYNPLFYASAILTIIFLLSFLININQYDASRITKVLQRFLAILAPLFLYMIINSLKMTIKTLNRLMVIFSYASALIITIYLAIFLSLCLSSHQTNFEFNHRFTFPHIHPNNAAAFIALISILFLLNIFIEKRKSILTLNIVFFGISFFALLLTYSRGAWVGFILSALWLLADRLNQKVNFLKLLKIIIPVLLISIVLFCIMPSFTSRFITIFDKGQTANASRLQIWKSTLTLINNNPWFNIGPSKVLGIGIRNFQPYFYKLNPNYPEVGLSHAHNNFFQITLEQGILGLLAFIAFLLLLFFAAFKEKKQTTGYKNYLSILLICWLINFTIQGLFAYSFMYREVMYAIMFLAAILSSLAHEETDKMNQSDE